MTLIQNEYKLLKQQLTAEQDESAKQKMDHQHKIAELQEQQNKRMQEKEIELEKLVTEHKQDKSRMEEEFDQKSKKYEK